MLYFVRHGQTDANVNKVYAGQNDVELNKNGIEQAKQTAKELKDINFDICFCSPLKRAAQTCQEIVKFHPELKIVCDERLKERDYGNLVGLPIGSIKFNRWKAGEDEEVNKKYNIENVLHLHDRVSNFYDDILQKYSGKNILIVAHSGIGRITIGYFKGMPKNLDFSGIRIGNAEVLKFEN